MISRTLSAAIFSGTLMIALLSQPGHAEIFTVNYTGDLPDVVPGDGVCSGLIDGTCSLRAAVMEANARAGHDTIFLESGQSYLLTLDGIDDSAALGDLDIVDDVLIVYLGGGARPVVDVNQSERAFEIFEAAVVLSNFDITGGNATVPGASTGGAIAVDFDAGVVQLIQLRLYGNRAEYGGALYNDGPATHISGSELYGNLTLDGFTDSGGNAIHNRGNLEIDQCSVFDNGSPAYPHVAIRNRPGFTGVPSLEIRNSTIANNHRVGVQNVDESLLTIVNSTIAGNVNYGLLVSGTGGNLQMRNSIVARNGFQDCGISPAATLNNNRYNLDSDNTCELSSGSSNYPGVEPWLTPLARHGGFTHAAWPLWLANSGDSPVIDQGHPVIGAIGCDPEDQHGTERPVDFDDSGTPRCDIGAIEMADDVIFFDPMELISIP